MWRAVYKHCVCLWAAASGGEAIACAGLPSTDRRGTELGLLCCGLSAAGFADISDGSVKCGTDVPIP